MTAETDLRDRLAAIVEREVKTAHADILRELAEARAEADGLKDQLRVAHERLATARDELNAARGIGPASFDANGVRVSG